MVLCGCFRRGQVCDALLAGQQRRPSTNRRMILMTKKRRPQKSDAVVFARRSKFHTRGRGTYVHSGVQYYFISSKPFCMHIVRVACRVHILCRSMCKVNLGAAVSILICLWNLRDLEQVLLYRDICFSASSSDRTDR